VVLFLTDYKQFKEYEKTQRQAHETAKNLGQVSKSVNFVVLAGLNFTFTVIPFIIVLLIDGILRSYSGNATVGISFLIISFAVAEFFGVLAHTSEQKKIQEQLHAQTQADNERLAKVIKEQS
jgi:tellurite resistance protein TehA-like permease